MKKILANKFSSAFTLIELLVVVAIIGILSTVVVVNLSASQVKARSVRIVTDFKAIESALSLLKNDQAKSAWWNEIGDASLSTNDTAVCRPGSRRVSTDCIINLSTYLPNPPIPPITTATDRNNYFYDNDSCDARTETTNLTNGVNLFIEMDNLQLKNKYLTAIDALIDRSDGGAAGKITTYDPGSGTNFLFYNIAYDCNK